MTEKPNLIELVYVRNAEKLRTETSNKTIMNTIIIGKDSHPISIMEMTHTHETQWKNIQSFNRLYDILRGQLGLYSVDDLVTAMSNSIPTEMVAAYEEARKVFEFVEGDATKADYLDGIGFLNRKGNPMTEFPKVTDKRL